MEGNQVGYVYSGTSWSLYSIPSFKIHQDLIWHVCYDLLVDKVAEKISLWAVTWSEGRRSERPEAIPGSLPSMLECHPLQYFWSQNRIGSHLQKACLLRCCVALPIVTNMHSQGIIFDNFQRPECVAFLFICAVNVRHNLYYFKS